MNKVPVSVVIITKNEEKNIERCLKSVSFAEEVIVIDSGSTDRTVEIAKALGAKVFVEEWKGFGLQKQSGVEKAKNRWVLNIDADERIPEETAGVIAEVIKNPSSEVTAYSFCRKNIFRGRWIRGCGWWPDRVVRLFDKSAGHFEGEVHEKWVLKKGRVGHLSAVIEHYHRDFTNILQKVNTYSTLSARELYRRGIKPAWWKPFFHGGWRFFYSYVIKKGFLYGMDGFVISLCNGLGTFFKYVKLWELSEIARGKK
jgi:glycosyltransferase involved in cell wall biosynthesis